MNRARVAIAALAALALVTGCRAPAAGIASPESVRWYKGTTHVHTLWSDGDDFPEMVAGWYKRNGYDFIAITDHNTLASAERWYRVPPSGAGAVAYRRYVERFGPTWVEERRSGDTVRVRLKRFEEYRARVEEPGRFILVPGEEITQYLGGRGAHMNALNLVEVVEAQPGATLVEMFQRDLDALARQAKASGRDIIGVLNHPNFLWSQTAEDLLALRDLRFFELYNGHPLVNNAGDALHAGVERMWDIVNTRRLAHGDTALLYGVATDDSHDYHEFGAPLRNPGRGWIAIRARELDRDSLMAAMVRGDFYASTGVTLSDVRRDGARLALRIDAQPGVTYRTQFVGTRRGYDTTTIALRDTAGVAVTRRYAPSLGEVLAEVAGASPSYTLRGDELYVRARVISSRAKASASDAGEVEMAWTQPLRPGS